ncbi:methyl coenzyme M reductase subunit gamma [Rothia mucilaginosa]|uniref:methyl coenzyme M reductase subunit gamma n=1 Tax=Rothia mucilaginosa TaxID=43675 RepID=UPI0028D14248|nr:methyl coenzyme M reductase subunit gamma [Rothia mucilaginosa]
MKTLKNRPTRSGLATLSATLMLALSACGGGQTTGESAKTSSASNTPVVPASASVSAASQGSVSVVAEPKGSEVVEVRAADDTNADPAIAKEAATDAAKRVVAQDNRLLNTWMHGDFEHTSDEELLKYVAPEKLDVIKRDIQDARNDIEKAGGPLKGQVNIRDLSVTDIFTYDYPDGTSHPYSVLRVKYCEDWTDVRMPDGERAVTGEKSTITMEVSVLRLQDGRYVYNGARALGKGCASS